MNNKEFKIINNEKKKYNSFNTIFSSRRKNYKANKRRKRTFKDKNIYDATLYFDSEEEKNIPLPLIIRPGLYDFLDYASENFDLVVFTASDQDYADTIINYIEKEKKYFSFRLYRNNCLFIEPGLYIKDLRIFNNFKNMKDIIILDNSLFSFANQLNNGILITSFFDDKNDTFLMLFFQILFVALLFFVSLQSNL